MSASADPQALCPICGKPAEAAYKPFCSKRCADIDLSRWLKGVYVIPGKPEEEDAETPEDDKRKEEP